MGTSFRPRVLHDVAAHPTEPQAVVEAFLGALAAGDPGAAAELLAGDVSYVNVGLPAIRGRRRTIAVLRPLTRPGRAIELYVHAITVNAGTVLTERTDAIVLGRCRFQFWVVGRFDVRDGRIVHWRESFDYLDVLRGVVRGLVGAVVPALRPKAPASPDVPPGRH